MDEAVNNLTSLKGFGGNKIGGKIKKIENKNKDFNIDIAEKIDTDHFFNPVNGGMVEC